MPVRLSFWWPLVALSACVLVLGTLAWRRGGGAGAPPLVVYCAHDSVFSEPILQQFERETGIPVVMKFDTEATKSLGLVERLIQEAEAPQCDVFWNNELLGTLDLAARGVLEPYAGPGHARIPKKYKDEAGLWTGFAARLRVKIRRDVPDDQFSSRDGLERFAIAKPLYGTTLTHYTALWHHEGGDALQAWHADSLKRGMQVVNGNGVVKDLVASGACDDGWTDTDDYFVARDAGAQVKIEPIRIGNHGTICIPNTVAMIKGTRQRQAAERLVDFLLSRETELALARSPSRQIPLGPVDATELPAEVRELRGWAEEGLDLRGLLPIRNQTLAWLKQVYAP